MSRPFCAAPLCMETAIYVGTVGKAFGELALAQTCEAHRAALLDAISISSLAAVTGKRPDLQEAR